MTKHGQPEATIFANPIPEAARETISKHESAMTVQRSAMIAHRRAPAHQEAHKEAQLAKLGHLALALTRKEYDSPQAYLSALDEYEVAWKSGTLPSIDMFSPVSSYLQTGKKAAEALLAGQGIYPAGKRQWVVTVPAEDDGEREAGR